MENRHASSPRQRFGCDFLIVRDLHTHSADPPVLNEKFYCFGDPVLAPGDGTVVALVGGIVDNAPDGAAPGEGEGIPAHFLGYSADGSAVERGEPRRGQFVRSA